MGKTFNFPDFAPDIAQVGVGTSGLISGVVPQGNGYGPWQEFEALTTGLPSACRGYIFARRSDGAIAVFAGTINHIYLLNNSNMTWAVVSKGGVPYPDLVAHDNWEFRQFNDFVIAVQVNTPPQKFMLSSSALFEDLGGSPPQAGRVAIVNRFVVLTSLLSNSRRVQWSDLDAPETWAAGTGLADYQDLPDGGAARAVSGGDVYGIIFQDESIRSMTYAPGSAVTFQIVRISENDALYAYYSVVEVNGYVFFISAQGFKVIEPGGVPKQIGKDRVDKTFFADVDPQNLQLVIGVADPKSTRVYWPYKSLGNSSILFDKVLSFDRSIGQNGKWSLLPISGEFLGGLARPGLTLENLDPLAPTPLDILGAANNGSGVIRLTLNALSNANFTVVGQNFIVVYDVEGTVEANGTWAIVVVDATHIDLVGSAFVNAYTGGGHIGGSLDALPFSLDSVTVASISSLAAFDSTHKLGFFSGDNIEAVLETDEQDLEGDLVFISSVRPLTDSGDALCSVGGRMRPVGAVGYTAEAPIETDNGTCSMRIETRYARVRQRIPAGSVWTYTRGVQPEAVLAGDR